MSLAPRNDSVQAKAVVLGVQVAAVCDAEWGKREETASGRLVAAAMGSLSARALPRALSGIEVSTSGRAVRREAAMIEPAEEEKAEVSATLHQVSCGLKYD